MFFRYTKLILLMCFISLAPGPAGAVDYLPLKEKYDIYLASPRSQSFKFGMISVNDNKIDNTGSSRYDLQAGGRFGLVNWNNNWQFSIFGSLTSIFDKDHYTDNIGWDGRFGATLSRRLSDSHSLKLEYRHQSAHIGDELIERTDYKRKRIDYTREEFNLGFSFLPVKLTRIYLEGGYGWGIRNPELQEKYRLQTGVEYGVPRQPNDEQKVDWGPFVALDLEFMEERDWQTDSTLQLGFYGLRGTNLWRLGVEIRDGRVPLGEFSQTDETYYEIALWQSRL